MLNCHILILLVENKIFKTYLELLLKHDIKPLIVVFLLLHIISIVVVRN